MMSNSRRLEVEPVVASRPMYRGVEGIAFEVLSGLVDVVGVKHESIGLDILNFVDLGEMRVDGVRESSPLEECLHVARERLGALSFRDRFRVTSHKLVLLRYLTKEG